MFKRVLFLIGFISVTAWSVNGQSGSQNTSSVNSNWCHTHSKWDELALKDPTLLTKRDLFRQSVKDYIARHQGAKTSDPVLVIPVVFHVIHDNGPENISESTIQSAINEMNRHFRKDNADSTDIASPFNNFHPDTRIEFRRARISPTGKCTAGITRTQSSLTVNADDAVKNLVRWDNYKYLNVWVVRNIGSGAGGYSYTPPVNDNIDGIVIRYLQLSALAHEAGHWLGLNHTWGPSNDANASGNCSLDDDIDDTPNTLGQSWCNTSRNSCTDQTYVDGNGDTLWVGDVIDNAQNIMDYGFCLAENFTNGQRDFMRGTLNSTVNGRNNLWTNANLLVTGTEDGHQIITCPPTADFSVNTQVVCAGEQVLFSDESFGETVDSYIWEFEGGSPATASVPYPSVIYYTPGTYKVTLIATNNTFGSDTTTKVNYINVIDTDKGVDGPFGEGFETSDILDNGDSSWTIINSSSSGWIQTDQAGYSGFKSIRMKNSSIPKGETSSLISPYIDLSKVMNCNSLSFRHAYAQKSSGDNDILKVMISTDCGKSWDVAYFVSGSQLSTVGEYVPFTFVPQATDEWDKTDIPLSQYVGEEHVLIKFEGISDLGNVLYLDHINIGCESDAQFLDITEDIVVQNATIFPNPSNGDLNIEFQSGESGMLSVSIHNSLGQLVYSKTVVSNTGANRHVVPASELPDKGVYIMSINSTNSSNNKGKTHIYRKIVRY